MVIISMSVKSTESCACAVLVTGYVTDPCWALVVTIYNTLCQTGLGCVCLGSLSPLRIFHQRRLGL